MIKGSTFRQADWPIDPLFLDRWSARAMDGSPLQEDELLTLLEAARWAPSSSNYQPWRFLYALRAGPHWPAFMELLNAGNRAWAQQGGALLLFVSRTVHDDGQRPWPTHSFDTGAAWQSLALQASLRGYVCHGMAGFDHERARRDLQVPAHYALEAMAVVGRPGDPALLAEKDRLRERPSARRPLAQSARHGHFSFAD